MPANKKLQVAHALGVFCFWGFVWALVSGSTLASVASLGLKATFVLYSRAGLQLLAVGLMRS
ncbi:hypothetical protein [Rhodoferax aquaticus]|uniref:Uncharacterized protein n=1 Tax=Rhodoferax aquaticus TaxID=2527691 RepID=A0A515EN18_9BURK|nr:hypothetical protein [Rhodoferax aquaticus]QDL54056.1 hypothetical protein EXZ61_07665 [Rhodoferax aquaticus]